MVTCSAYLFQHILWCKGASYSTTLYPLVVEDTLVNSLATKLPVAAALKLPILRVLLSARHDRPSPRTSNVHKRIPPQPIAEWKSTTRVAKTCLQTLCHHTRLFPVSRLSHCPHLKPFLTTTLHPSPTKRRLWNYITSVAPTDLFSEDLKKTARISKMAEMASNGVRYIPA